MKNFYMLFWAVLIVSATFVKVQSQTNHFVPKGDPTSAMNIQILEARFNGMDLEAGDEIGIFDGNICVGAFVLTKSLGTYNDANLAAAKAYKEDVGGDGFVIGHTITYRFWDKSESFECNVIASTCYTNQLAVVTCPKFDVGTTTYVQLIGNCFIDHFPVSTGDVFSTNEDAPLTASVATNDVPSSDGGNVWSKLTDPAHGTLSFSNDGSFTYTPVANYNGPDGFTYQLCDGDGDCVSATVSITVVPVDDFPAPSADNVTTNEDTPVSGSVAGNDTPSGDGGNVWSKVSDPLHGTATINVTGNYTYSPALNYNGPDSFLYQLCDADGDCVTALVSVTINPVDDFPVANGDNVGTNEDAPVSGSVAGNDTPSGDGGNVWSKVTDPLHGTVTLDPAGNYTYTPAPNYNGADSFKYKLCDADGDCSEATVTITVAPVDDQPVAVADAFTTDEDVVLTGNVATNDTPSPDGGNVWTKLTDPAHGSAVVGTGGVITYTPATNYNGSDSFVYKLCDGDGDCVTALVTITVNSVNDLPVANVDNVNAIINAGATGTLATNDILSGDGGNVFTKKTDPLHGTVTVGTTGTFTYTPVTDYTGSDSFIYELCDANNDCDTAIVKISVFFNPYPTANVDVITTAEDTPYSGSVAGNDYPSSDGGEVFNKFTDPLHGTVIMGVTGTFTYTPAANYNGSDSFIYKVCDANNDCDTAIVKITVTSVNDLPVAAADAFSTNEDTPLSGSVSGNDSPSGDGGNVWSKSADPAHGTVVVNANGAFTYTPAANYNGPDSFKYKVCDIDDECSEAEVTITVVSVNDLPVAMVDYVTAVEDTPLSTSVAGNDVPSGDGGNVWSKHSDPAHGTVIVLADGSFTYSPAANYYGSDSFVYKLCDADSDCDTAIVKITVTSVDEFPTAVVDYVTTNEDTPFTGSVTGNDTPSNDGGNVWSKQSDPAHGLIAVTSDGGFTYTPVVDFNGNDSFVYKICDTDGDCDTAIVRITVTSVNDVPAAKPDDFFIKSGGLLTGNLARNDINSGDGGNVWSLFTPPSHGSATVSPEGLFTYISEPDYIGLDSFVYQLCDVNGDCVTAVVNVDVYNAPPELKLVEFYCVYLTQYGKWTLNSNNKRQITAGSTAHFGTYNDLTFAFSRVSFNCSDVPGPLNIEVTASDERGSTTTGHFRLYVLDTIPPVAMCKNADLYLDNNGQAYLFQGQIDNGSSDNCGIDEIYLDKQLFTTADIGVKKVTLTVVDRGGNTAQCTASVTVHPRATVVVSVAKVNLAPTIADIKDISIGKDALSQEVALTYITAGETDGSQKVTSVTAITDNTQLVTGIKVIYWDGESTGKLLITAASGVSGEAMVTIIVKDNGGTGNGGVDTFMKTFKVIVNTINTPVAVTPVGETNAEVVTASIDYRDEFGLKFWPNPTRGPVNIDLTGNNNNPVILKVYTIQGVELFMRVYPAGEPIRFDLAGKVTGIYVIELSTGMKTINRKIVLTD